jgi:hypothetical protein
MVDKAHQAENNDQCKAAKSGSVRRINMIGMVHGIDAHGNGGGGDGDGGGEWWWWWWWR